MSLPALTPDYISSLTTPRSLMAGAPARPSLPVATLCRRAGSEPRPLLGSRLGGALRSEKLQHARSAERVQCRALPRCHVFAVAWEGRALTEAELKKLKVKELKDLAVSLDIELVAKKKADIIAVLQEQWPAADGAADKGPAEAPAPEQPAAASNGATPGPASNGAPAKKAAPKAPAKRKAAPKAAKKAAPRKGKKAPAAAEAAPAPAPAAAPPAEAAAAAEVPSELMVGFDFGTNTSCYVVSAAGSPEEAARGLVPTVVGYPKQGIIGGVLPDDREVYIGEMALQNRMYLDLVYPMSKGVVTNSRACADFMRELLKMINPLGAPTIKAVIGVPANSTEADAEVMRDSIRGIFQQVLLAPEPFLSAMGLRDDSRLSDPTYIDPIKSSLFIDIGAGTTDLCLVQGYFPTAADQLSFPFAGDAIDELLGQGIAQQYPETTITKILLRQTKERFSHVGPSQTGMEMKVLIKGKPRSLEVGPLVNKACLPILDQIAVNCMDLVATASPELISDVLQNMILTGGGSQINLLAEELQKRMEAEGYDSPVVRPSGEEYKFHVAHGAWKVGCTARPEQWQSILK